MLALTIQLTEHNWWMYALAIYIPSSIIYAMFYQRGTLAALEDCQSDQPSKADLIMVFLARVNWGILLTAIVFVGSVIWAVGMTVIWPFVWITVALGSYASLGKVKNIGWIGYFGPKDIFGNWVSGANLDNILAEGNISNIAMVMMPTLSLIGSLIALFTGSSVLTGAIIGAGLPFAVLY